MGFWPYKRKVNEKVETILLSHGNLPSVVVSATDSKILEQCSANFLVRGPHVITKKIFPY